MGDTFDSPSKPTTFKISVKALVQRRTIHIIEGWHGHRPKTTVEKDN